ncbi:hypothetical protein H4R99_007425 [Coemansia sp. RSA 1722]|nr:hypothetical protein IWW45_008522 [Coemansia sp. RSA 485]KAJ2589546.1 hypothetical protein H4R99_007425 [Coemansia sp. RSA 1722]
MGSENGNWCLIESDPGVFTELIQNMGARDVQVEELYSLDSETLKSMEPLYGLIFLFKWQRQQQQQQQSQSVGSPAATEADSSKVYFAQQVIQNACATQAILSVLLNRPEIELGERLENFRSFSVDLPADMRGLALANCDQIRQVHNSFVRPESFLADDRARPATEDDDVFHFVSYVPIGGRLYELDGLKPAPIDHGATNDWLEDVGRVIQQRMAEYSRDEIRFNLLAVIGDRRKLLNQRVSSIDANISRLLARLEALRLDDSSTEEDDEVSRLQSQIGQLSVERADLEHLVEVENGKFARYRFDNSLRKHNFIPLVFQLVSAMAQKGVLDDAMVRAEEKAKARKLR